MSIISFNIFPMRRRRGRYRTAPFFTVLVYPTLRAMRKAHPRQAYNALAFVSCHKSARRDRDGRLGFVAFSLSYLWPSIVVHESAHIGLYTARFVKCGNTWGEGLGFISDEPVCRYTGLAFAGLNRKLHELGLWK